MILQIRKSCEQATTTVRIARIIVLSK